MKKYSGSRWLVEGKDIYHSGIHNLGDIGRTGDIKDIRAEIDRRVAFNRERGVVVNDSYTICRLEWVRYVDDNDRLISYSETITAIEPYDVKEDEND